MSMWGLGEPVPIAKGQPLHYYGELRPSVARFPNASREAKSADFVTSLNS